MCGVLRSAATDAAPDQRSGWHRLPGMGGQPQRFTLEVTAAEVATIEAALSRALKDPGEHAFVEAKGRDRPQAPVDEVLRRIHEFQDEIDKQRQASATPPPPLL